MLVFNGDFWGSDSIQNLKRGNDDDVKDFFIVIIVDTALTFATSEKKKEK